MRAACLIGLTEWRWRMPPPIALPSDITAIAKAAVMAHRAQRGFLTRQGADVVSIQHLPGNAVTSAGYPAPILRSARRAL